MTLGAARVAPERRDPIPVRRADFHMGLAQMGARMGSIDDGPTSGKPPNELERYLESIFSISGDEGRRRYDADKRRRREELDRIAFRSVLRELRENFEQTENPLFVWIAIQHCTRREKRLPKWIIEYLTDSADALIESTLRLPRRVDAAVARALGFKYSERSNPFSDFKKYQRREKLALSFARKVLSGKKPNEAVIQIAEEARLSETTVWKEILKFYTDIPMLTGRGNWKPLIERLSEYPEFQFLLFNSDH